MVERHTAVIVSLRPANACNDTGSLEILVRWFTADR
jgi:hypothetical protein